jgi:cyclophilin family peptidyl-prolyl cis-trans isomerase
MCITHRVEAHSNTQTQTLALRIRTDASMGRQDHLTSSTHPLARTHYTMHAHARRYRGAGASKSSSSTLSMASSQPHVANTEFFTPHYFSTDGYSALVASSLPNTDSDIAAYVDLSLCPCTPRARHDHAYLDGNLTLLYYRGHSHFALLHCSMWFAVTRSLLQAVPWTHVQRQLADL